MKVDLIEFSNIVYIDPNIDDYGILLDGKTPETAYKEVPTLTDNTCYVVRRYDDYAAQFTNSSSAVKNIMLLGMPRPGEKYFEYMSPEIQAAWGNDEARIGCFKFDKTSTTSPVDENWTSTAKHHCILTALEYMRIENCRLMRTSASKFTSGRGVGFMFVINSSKPNIIVNNCEFGYEFTKMKDYYKTNPSLISEEIQKFSHYITTDTASNFVVTKSYIDAACVSDSGDDSGNASTEYLTDFSMRTSCDNAVIENCEVYTFGRINNTVAISPRSHNDCVFMCAAMTNTKINNVDFYLLYNKNQITGCNRGLFNFNFVDGADLYFNNINIKQALFSDYNLEDNIHHGYTHIDGYLGNMIADNIKADLTSPITKTRSASVISFSSIPRSDAGLNKCSLKNIEISLYTEDTIVNDREKACLTFTCSSQRITSHAVSDGSSNHNRYNNAFIATIENIKIKTNGTAVYLDRANVISGEITGKLKLGVYNYVKLYSITNISDNFYTIECPDDSGNIVLVDKLYVTSSDNKACITPNDNYASYSFNNNTIIINEANYLPFNMNISSNANINDRSSILICKNYENGKLFAKNMRASFISSAITRNNRKINSIIRYESKCDAPANDWLNLGKYSLLPGFKQTVSSGIYDIAFYVSSYNIEKAQLIKRYVNIILHNFEDNYYIDLGKAELLEDSSTWDDNNVTAYKYVLKNVIIPKTLASQIQERDIFFDITCKAYGNGGYIYIDTIPEITKVGEAPNNGDLTVKPM